MCIYVYERELCTACRDQNPTFIGWEKCDELQSLSPCLGIRNKYEDYTVAFCDECLQRIAEVEASQQAWEFSHPRTGDEPEYKPEDEIKDEPNEY